MTPAEWEELRADIDVIVRLLALNAVADLSRQDQVNLLHRAGLPPRRIADILGTTPNTVSVTLSKMRGAKK